MAGFLLINPRSGDAAPSAEELQRAARKRSIEAHIVGREDDAEVIARSAYPEAIGVAGGDGTLAPIAAIAVERNVPFVCVPFGTRNHFARDLGIDREDPIAALGAFAGTERRIDLGRVGDRLFLNNVSLGVYGQLVHRREHQRRRREALARLRAWWIPFTNREKLELTIDGVATDANLILVANNAYALRPFALGKRERLDEGLLHLYVVDERIDERTGKRFTVAGVPAQLKAAVDGEPVTLEPPMEFSIEPRALRVLVPPGV